jgi:hypothetical protein
MEDRARGQVGGLATGRVERTHPSPAQQTALAFHYPSPRAPQAVLVAIPPVAAATCSTQVLVDIVRETFELARVRLVTPSALGNLSLLLPTT